MIIKVAFPLISLSLVWSLKEGQEIQEALQPPNPLGMGQIPMLTTAPALWKAPMFILPIQYKTCVEDYKVDQMIYPSQDSVKALER